jgi:hypothetical protein
MEDLKSIFDAADDYEYAVYQTLQKIAFREQEGMHLAGPDVNWKRGTISVTAKPEFKFRPKNSHERAVPSSNLIAGPTGESQIEREGIFTSRLPHKGDL